MQRFKWTKAHAVFLPEVDAEHRNLFHLADELQSAVLSKAEVRQVRETLRALIAATEDHFTHEERRMREAHYPSYVWHRQQHDTLRKKVSHLVPSIESGDGEAAVLLLEYLSGWLKDHTALTDRMMGAYLRNFDRQASPVSPVHEPAPRISA
jgi:hemerythrin-like metal-binding protein